MHILCSAEVFGFGPASSLLSMMRQIRASHPEPVTFHVIHTPNIEPLLPDWDNLQLLHGVNLESLDTVLAIEPPEEGFDLVIAGYDPASMVYARLHGIPSALYDGLFHFWPMESFEATVQERMAELEAAIARGDAAELVEVFTRIYHGNPYEMLFGGHFVADRSYIRKSKLNAAIFERFPELRERVVEKGCLHNPDVAPAPMAERTHFLVSLSGSLSPIIPLEVNLRYAEAVLELVVGIAKRPFFRQLPWKFVCHPTIAEALRDRDAEVPEHFEILEARPPNAFLELVRTSRALFCGSGYSAVEEPAHLRVPTFILPEQLSSYIPSAIECHKEGYPFDYNLTVTAHLQDFEDRYSHLGPVAMYDDIVALLRAPEHAALRERVIGGFEAMLADEAACAAHVQQQHDAIAAIMGGFEGAKEFYEDLCRTLLAPRG